jgi:nucleoside-diphosphate-sugar epimerase
VLAAVYSDWCELVPMYHQIERVARGLLQARLYPGSVDRGQTYVHVDAVAEAFLAAVEHLAGESGLHRLMVGETRPVTHRQINHAADRAFGYGERRIFEVPEFVAREGARLMGWWRGLRDEEPFIRPWMIEFAGEHFEFDLTATRRALGWEPDGYLGDRLDAICDRAAIHRDIWLAKNEARPW